MLLKNELDWQMKNCATFWTAICKMLIGNHKVVEFEIRWAFVIFGQNSISNRTQVFYSSLSYVEWIQDSQSQISSLPASWQHMEFKQEFPALHSVSNRQVLMLPESIFAISGFPPSRHLCPFKIHFIFWFPPLIMEWVNYFTQVEEFSFSTTAEIYLSEI